MATGKGCKGLQLRQGERRQGLLVPYLCHFCWRPESTFGKFGFSRHIAPQQGPSGPTQHGSGSMAEGQSCANDGAGSSAGCSTLKWNLSNSSGSLAVMIICHPLGNSSPFSPNVDSLNPAEDATYLQDSFCAHTCGHFEIVGFHMNNDLCHLTV